MNNPIIDFRKYALWYFNDWLWFDKDFCSGMAKPSPIETLREAAKYYGVSRNFKDIGEKLSKITDAIGNVQGPLNNNNIDEKVIDLSSELAKINGKPNGNQISAASKFLWLRFKAPVVIFDTRAVTSLKKLSGSFRDNDYGTYRQIWNEHFEEKADEIIKSCSAIHQCLKLEFDTETDVLSKRWFFERTFDKYLWHRGKNQPNWVESLPSPHRAIQCP